MDIVNKDQAIVAERAGAVAVMVLERVPSDILKYGNPSFNLCYSGIIPFYKQVVLLECVTLK
jgi:pyridoxal biosynthesis lyase PdxS